MSIMITITGDEPVDIYAKLAALIGGRNVERAVGESPDLAAPYAAEPPKVEPEIVPPKRTRAPKKADTVVQADVTDIDKNGDPVDPYAALTADERGDLLKKVMVAVMDAKGEDRVIALLGEHKVKNRSEAIASADFAKIVAAFEAEVA